MKHIKLWQTATVIGLLSSAPFAAALLNESQAASGPEFGTIAMLGAGTICLILARNQL